MAVAPAVLIIVAVVVAALAALLVAVPALALAEVGVIVHMSVRHLPAAIDKSRIIRR